MSIASDLIRGHTDTIILAQLLQEDSYGYKINKRIQELTQTKRSYFIYRIPAARRSRLHLFLLGK